MEEIKVSEVIMWLNLLWFIELDGFFLDRFVFRLFWVRWMGGLGLGWVDLDMLDLLKEMTWWER